jgi:hypothetical protein
MQKHKLRNSLKITLFVNIFLIFSCNEKSKKSVDFAGFNISIPKNWQKIELQGVDSKVSGIITDKRDTLFIDFGQNSNSFNEIPEIRSLERKKEYDSVGFRYPKSMIFSEQPELDQAQAIYLKEYFYYDTIDGKKAKVGIPKAINDGRCLIYISQVDNKGNKLSIYTQNVDEATQKEILISFKSIKFKPSR